MYEAILFDLDGTLLDTLEDLADSCNAVLAARGLPTHPTDSYRVFVGDGMENLFRRALPQGRRDDEGEVRACVEAMRVEYGKRWARKTVPYEGIRELLDGIAGRNVAAAVLSNKPHEFTVEMVDRFFGPGRFQAVFGARPGVAKKPDPAAALEVSRILAVPPSRFLYAGDTNTDMRTAVNAGMFPLGVLWGFRGAMELKEAGARTLIAHPGQILDLLGGAP